MRVLRELIQTVAPSRSTVLITGESGTGKELVAQALHAAGTRSSGPFVPINCGAIPKDLIESELFGHRRGSFTGAFANRIGRFEMANGGTLFLDEVGDLPVETQVKLLRVLQERCIEPIGATDSVPIDVRIIAATNRDLMRDVQRGRFREDLFYRLNVIPMRTAPLRERSEDIEELLGFYALHHRAEGSEPVSFCNCLLDAFRAYDWPGNVRELSNLVDRFSALYPSQSLQLKFIPAWLLPPALARAKSAGPDLPAASGAEATADLEHEGVRLLAATESDGIGAGKAHIGPPDVGHTHHPVMPSPGEMNPAEDAIRLALGMDSFGAHGISLRERISDIERGFIEQAMLRAKGNVSQAARLLCLQRTTLIEKLHKHGLKRSCD